MRERIFHIIEPYKETSFSQTYDAFMIVAICLSLVPLLFKESNAGLNIIDKATVTIFILDYILRWVTADYKFEKKEALSFLRYPFSPMAIIDLLSILPSITLLNEGFKTLRILRLLRAIKAFKLIRYSKSVAIVVRVLRKEEESLLAVLGIALGYIFVSALVMFQVEPNTFDNFYDAIYWATISLTTIGYGDIYATSGIGQAITMISSLLGIAVVALPAGIITAGYLDELQNEKKNKE